MKRAPAPRPEWIETCAIEHGSGNVIDFPMVQDLRVAALGRQPRLHRPEPVVRALRRRRPARLPALRPRSGARARRSSRCARPRCVVRDGARRRSSMPTLREDHRLARASTSTCRSCAGRRRRRSGAFAKALAQALAARDPELITAEYRDREAAARAACSSTTTRTRGGARSPRSTRCGRSRARRSSAPVTGTRSSAASRIEDFRIDNMPPAWPASGDLWEPLLARDAGASASSACCDACRSRRRTRRWRRSSSTRSRAAPGWQYEPKWDGFRCLAFRDGDEVELQSKAGQPLARYFPEVVETLRRCPRRRFVLDGEIVDPDGRTPLVRRAAPAHPPGREPRSRSSRGERPAMLIVFDLLVDAGGQGAGRASRSAERRRRAGGLRGASARPAATTSASRPPPRTRRRPARGSTWPAARSTASSPSGSTCRTSPASAPACRRSSACARRTASSAASATRRRPRVVGSLLLGLYDDGRAAPPRRLHVRHPGRRPARRSWPSSTPLDQGAGLHRPARRAGRAAGAPSARRMAAARTRSSSSRCSTTTSRGGRFRHGTRFLRWRPDKAPRQCTLDQVAVSTREPGLPDSAAARPPGSGAGSRRTAPSTSRRSSAGTRKRAGRR